MRPLITWTLFTAVTLLALWQLIAPNPIIPLFAAGIVLFVVGGLAGLRWGADSAGKVIKEMAGLNEYLAEQNQDLTEVNQILLKQLNVDQEDTPLATESEKSATGEQ